MLLSDKPSSMLNPSHCFVARLYRLSPYPAVPTQTYLLPVVIVLMPFPMSPSSIVNVSHRPCGE